MLVRKWIFNILILGFLPTLAQAVSFSDLNFTPSSGDLSMTYLGLIFGSVSGAGLSGGTNQLIGQIFAVFNTGVLVMTMTIIGYTVFTTVVGVSQEGSGAFQTKISPWVTMRIVTGSSLLIPSFGGYSGIQVLVMTVVVKGIGFANVIWNQVISYCESGGSVISGASESGGSSITPGAIRSNTIGSMSSQVDELAKLVKIGACVYHANLINGNYSGQPPLNVVEGSKVTFQVPANKEGMTPINCGSMVLSDSGSASMILRMAAEGIIGNTLSIIDSGMSCTASQCGALQSTLYLWSDQLMRTIYQVEVEMSQNISSGKAWAREASNRGWITAAAYYPKLISGSSSQQKLPPYEEGSQGAGYTVTYDKSAVTNNGNLNSFVGKVGSIAKKVKDTIESNIPKPPPVVGSGGGPEFKRAKSKIIASLKKGYLGLDSVKSGDTFTKGPISTGYTGLAGSNVYFAFDHMLVLTNTIVEKLTGCRAAQCSEGAGGYDFNGCQRIKASDKCAGDYAQTNGFLGMLYKQTRGIAYNPLDEMRQLGTVMISASVNYWKTTLDVMYSTTVNFAWATFGARLAINVPLGIAGAAMYGFAIPGAAIVGGIQATLNSMLDIFVQLTKAALEVYVPFGTALATMFFAMGVVLGIYLPFMPYLLYIFGAIGWMIGVAESLVAAPLVAMGLTHPEGHDLLGKAEQSLMLMLGIFIRPATMLIGFIFAINMATIAVGLLNRGFMQVLVDFLGSSSSGSALVATVTLVGAMLVYTYVMMSVLDQAYSLIYQIPDRILRWIGGPADAPGAGAAQAAREVKQQTQSAGQQAGQGAGQAMKAPSINVDSSAGQIDSKGLADDVKSAQADQKDSSVKSGG